MGFSEVEKDMIANIAQYHSKITPVSGSPSLNGLTDRQKVTVAKLAAVIRLADAVDRAHRQKITGIDMELKGNELTITVNAHTDISLEEWTFLDKVVFFEGVFGIRAILNRITG